MEKKLLKRVLSLASLLVGGALLNMIPAQAQMTQAASVGLVPYQDTWADARPRWWDIASYHDTAGDHYNQYNGWGLSYDSTSGTVSSSVFQYQGGQLTLTYDQKPNKPYFIGHVDATGLKPNFAYQLKLVGKPLYGPRGCGPYTVKNAAGTTVSMPDGGGEDWANDAIGHIGRWWNDSNASGNTNAITDSVYASTYPTDTIYGYIFMGDFITDAAGNASVDFTGNNNYHITFQNWQSGGNVRLAQSAPNSPATLSDSIGPYFLIGGAGSAPGNTPPYYAYGPQAPSSFYVDSLDPNFREDGYQKVYLWYQYEMNMTAGRPQYVSLPAGHYQCRLLVTEESFHNNYGATSSPYGGKWKTVLANEDFTTDAGGNTVPDTSASNDIVFDVPNSSGVYVAPPAAPANLTFTTGTAQVSLAWSAVSGATYYNIKRSTIASGPYVKIAGGVNTKTTSYTDNAVTPGVGYYYMVCAVTAGVEGPNSSAAQPKPVAPAAPSGLTAKAVTGAKMTLTWADNSSNESGFKIERYNKSWSQIATVGAGVTTYTDSGLQTGKSYSYRVRAYNAIGNSAYSNTVTATAIR